MTNQREQKATRTYAPERTKTRGRTVRIGDLELHYEDFGAGKPLVLLHGFGGCSQNWQPFTAELSMHHRLIVVDLRGHGHSTNPDDTFTHRDAATDVLGLLDELGIEHFSAMGMSTGAMALLHMATRQPERIESMVLISATSHFPDQARAIMRRASFETMPPDVRAMYRECAKRGDGQIRRLVGHFNALHENHDDMNFTAQSLSAVEARTLIVHGDRDQFFPVEIAVSMFRAIPRAELWVIPGGDHVPVFDSTVPFASEALRFLNAPEAR
ncbi:alpha/beta fold hydrolase [Nannocystaceae bacterium ST9]